MGSLPGLSEVESTVGIEAGRSNGALMMLGFDGGALGEVEAHFLSCIDILCIPPVAQFGDISVSEAVFVPRLVNWPHLDNRRD
jgi:hypothetical protein